MDVPGGPGEHKGSTIFLEQCGGFQRALEAVSDGHHAEIEVPHPQGADKLGIGAVADLSIGHIGQGGVDALLILIYCQHLVAQVPELLGQVAAKPPQADH